MNPESYDDLTVDELRRLLRSRGQVISAFTSKAEVIKMLRDLDAFQAAEQRPMDQGEPVRRKRERTPW